MALAAAPHAAVPELMTEKRRRAKNRDLEVKPPGIGSYFGRAQPPGLRDIRGYKRGNSAQQLSPHRERLGQQQVALLGAPLGRSQRWDSLRSHPNPKSRRVCSAGTPSGHSPSPKTPRASPEGRAEPEPSAAAASPHWDAAKARHESASRAALKTSLLPHVQPAQAPPGAATAQILLRPKQPQREPAGSRRTPKPQIPAQPLAAPGSAQPWKEGLGLHPAPPDVGIWKGLVLVNNLNQD